MHSTNQYDGCLHSSIHDPNCIARTVSSGSSGSSSHYSGANCAYWNRQARFVPRPFKICASCFQEDKNAAAAKPYIIQITWWRFQENQSGNECLLVIAECSPCTWGFLHSIKNCEVTQKNGPYQVRFLQPGSTSDLYQQSASRFLQPTFFPAILVMRLLD